MATRKKSKTSKKSSKRGSSKKSSYVNLGILCEAQEPDENGNPSYYIKLGKDVEELIINGQSVEGDYINLQSPAQKFEGLLTHGVIDEDEYEESMEKYDEGGEYEGIKYFVSVKL